MIYGSVCSGIEAATVAWHPLGWRPAFFSEIDKFPSAVLAHHYPHVPNLGDMTHHEEWDHEPIDLLVGGTPCQSFSIAGLRKGMADPRGNLALVFLGIVDRTRPRWVVWENVPGVLSSNGGRDFGSFLGGLGELGYGWAYRVVDAQYCRVDGFGRAVPQRRRRVFVVGYLGDWRRAAAVLFEREGLSGNPAPRREAWKDVAPTISARPTGGGGLGTDFDYDGGLITDEIARCVTAGYAQRLDFETENFVAHALRGEGFDASEDGTGRGTPLVTIAFDCKASGRNGFGIGEISPTLRAMNGADRPNGGGQVAVAIQERAVSENLESSPQGNGYQESIAYTLEARNKVQAVATSWAVRRLTPREEVRLFGGDGKIVGALAAEQGMKQTTYVAVANEEKTLQSVRVKQGDCTDASTEETDARALLRRVREQVGEEAFTQWGLGILDTLQPSKILRSEMHGEEFRSSPQDGSKMVGGASRSEIDGVSGAMRAVRLTGRERRSPPGQKLSKQCQGELGTHLSKLPQSRAFAEAFMFDLWEASQGLGLLRQALSALQEVWRPDDDTRQSAQPAWAVRRLTPTEAERLQGFPDDYSLIPYRGKPAADGPRYKALGNSMAVNCMRWLGMRIQMVESIMAEQGDAA